MEKNIGLEAILDTYDPNWEARHDEINERLQAAFKEYGEAAKAGLPTYELGRKQEELLAQLHQAFHAQFRTAGQYNAWQEENLIRAAESERKILILPELPEGATVQDINRRAAGVYNALREQNIKQLPVGQPEGLTAFQETPGAGVHRTSFHHIIQPHRDYEIESRCTIDQTADKAFVCFHHLPDARGCSPTNGIDRLATGTREFYLPHIKPENIEFFIHLPISVGGGFFNEHFSRVDMQWQHGQYNNPEWAEFNVIPAAIREAELKPYDEPPEPPARASNQGLLGQLKRLRHLLPK